MDYEFILDGMTWSFSRLNSFGKCNYEWFLHYIECNKGAGGFFSDYGSFVHLILQKYLSGELEIFELPTYYEEHYEENIHYDPPKNNYVDLKQRYYEKGLDYLTNIDLDRDSIAEILGVEKEIHFNLDVDGKEIPFVGYIDLLTEEKDGSIVVTDHKSSSIKILKNNKVSKTDQDHFLEFKRQLYLYSKAVIEEYGKPPTKLRWNMFKDRTWIEIDFDQMEYEESLEWARDVIRQIYKEQDWLPDTSNEFFCNNLCSMRFNACPYKITRYDKNVD